VIPRSLRKNGGKEIEFAVFLVIALLAALALYLLGEPECPPGAQRVTGWQGWRTIHMCVEVSR
jgi:hypothetical protein